MTCSKLLSLGGVFATFLALAACTTPPQDDPVQAGATGALTADSVGIICRTLGEIGQCGSTSLCTTSAQPSCKAKASALASSSDWARICNGMNVQMSCDWQANDCYWDTTTSCVPRSGIPSVGAPDLPATCSALGELNACNGVLACKSSTEGVCHATDDAIASDPQWQQMCPRAGTSQAACEVQSNCVWDNVNVCTPRATANGPLDIGSACLTLGQIGACGTVPSVCQTLPESQCIATASALASDPSWGRICLGMGSQQACGWQSECNWQEVDLCVPPGGPRPGSVVDTAKACDTLGQIGSCSRAPICKPVAGGSCRPTANALAGDPDWANQCLKAGTSADTCGWLAPNCEWVPTTSCVPR